MKRLLFLLFFLPVFLQAQTLFTVGTRICSGPPTTAPTGQGAREAFDILTNQHYFWSAQAMAWKLDPTGVSQTVGCVAPAFAPGLGEPRFAVNGCTPKPELYQYSGTGTAWLCLNCDAGSTYTAGTGISIASNIITNTGDLSATNELNTAASVTGGNLRITDPGGNLDVPVTNIAPVQAVAAGTGLSVAGTTTRTFTNTAPDQTVTISGAGISAITGTYPNFTVTSTEVDGSTTNELQTLSILGQALTLSNGGGTVTIPGSGSGGDDSTFAKTNGTYSGKRITDNVYRTAKTSFGSSYARGVINLYQSGNNDPALDTIPLIFGGGTTRMVQRYNNNSFGDDSRQFADFGMRRVYVPNIQPATDTSRNALVTYLLGYNVDRQKHGESAMYVSWESNFCNGNPLTDPWGWEFHFECKDTMDHTFRPISFTGWHNGGYGDGSLSADKFTWYDHSSTTPWMDMNTLTNTWDIFDGLSMRFTVNNSNILSQYNAAGSGIIPIIKVNAANQVEIAPDGTEIYTTATSIKGQNALTIAPGSSQVLTLGSTTTTSDVRIKGVSAVPLSLQSSINTTGYGFLVANFGFTIRDLATNFDIINFDNACPDRSISVHGSSGNVGIHAYPDFDIALHVKRTDQGAGYKLLSLENATGKSSFYRSNTVPTGGAVGDVALSENGNLYTNDGTAFRELAKVLKASGTLDFGSTLAGTSTDLTITVTGAADGDPVFVGVPNASTSANGLFTAWVSATNTVTVRFSNNSLTLAIDPVSGTFKVTVNK